MKPAQWLKNKMKTPLLIEQHFHGAYGVDFNKAGADDIIGLSYKLRKLGIGGFFPTLVTDSVQNINRQIAIIKEAAKSCPAILGIHLEGIFINPAKKGIHNPEHFLELTVENFQKIEDDFIKIVTLAPELDSGLIEYLKERKVKVQAGHSTGWGCVDGATHTYGIKNDADIKAKDVVFNHSGASFTCIVKDREYKVNLKMNGMFSVYNVLAALTTALALGMDIEKSIKTLEEIGGVAGRFEVIVNKPTVIVDYAHTPDGLENVLKAARDITPSDGRLICLFGCGGDRDATKRPKMGAIAEELADVVIVTSDNPRSEEPQQIITDILAGLKSVNEVIVEPDRELAIKEAHKIARENDVVLIAGKGHEDYQILANETIHFDDREKAREIFV